MEKDDIKVGDDVWVPGKYFGSRFRGKILPCRVKNIFDDGGVILVGWEWDDQETLDKMHYKTWKWTVYKSLEEAVSHESVEMYNDAVNDLTRKKEFMDYWHWNDDKRYS